VCKNCHLGCKNSKECRQDYNFMVITIWSDKLPLMVKYTVNCLLVPWEFSHSYWSGSEFARTHSLLWCASQAYSGPIFLWGGSYKLNMLKPSCLPYARCMEMKKSTTNKKWHPHISNVMEGLIWIWTSQTTGQGKQELLNAHLRCFGFAAFCVVTWSRIMVENR
jgi:hypothetical protein